MTTLPADVTGFWIAAGPRKWFKKSAAFDDAIRLAFEPDHHRAARSEYADWSRTAEGSLALLLLLDQFPRNLYRNSAHAFATDPLARGVAARAIDAGHDLASEPQRRPFFYLPFEHSEAMADQDRSVALCEALRAATGDVDTLKWALIHRGTIQRFGRFPHRNAALGRANTAEEQAFLDGGGFSG